MLRFAVAIWVASCGLAAANDCMAGSPDPVDLLDWQIVSDAEKASVTSTYENRTGRDIRMVRGSIMFTDPFGSFIGSVHLGPDVSLPAGSRVTETNLAMATPRFATIQREDVTATACVLGLVYADGTKEEF